MRSSPTYDYGSLSTSVQESCEIYVLAPHGIGATGRMLGIIESFLRLPLFSFPSEYYDLFSSDLSIWRPINPLTRLLEHCNVFSVLPGIAFSLHLTVVTGQYGVFEILLSSFMASFVFSVFGAQPLCIAGVTGLSIAAPPARFSEPHLILKALYPS